MYVDELAHMYIHTCSMFKYTTNGDNVFGLAHILHTENPNARINAKKERLKPIGKGRDFEEVMIEIWKCFVF